MDEEINKQVEENPLTKEESRAQFVEITKALGIKHSFNFEEAWEIGEEIRRRRDFRERITDVEKAIIESSAGVSGEELSKTNPVKSSFAGGCYIREIYNPPNELIITKIHKKEHPFFLMKGEMSILTEEGIQHIKAPYQGVTKPGTKRAIYTHSGCVFITVHRTDNCTVEEVEEEVVCTKYDELPRDSDVLKMLEKVKDLENFKNLKK